MSLVRAAVLLAFAAISLDAEVLPRPPVAPSVAHRFSPRAEGFNYTDDPLIVASTVVRLIHLTELRAAIDSVRHSAGMASFAWTDVQPPIVRAVHVVEMRSALGLALSQLGRRVPSWTDTLEPGVRIRAVHIQELRDATQFGATDASGTITWNTTWTPGNSPYSVRGDVTVTAGATLTLLPGTVLKFSPGTNLFILGGAALIANGTASQPIILTSIRDDSVGGDSNHDASASFPAPGDWGTLQFVGSNGVPANGSLTNAIVRYGQQLSVRLSAPTLRDLTSTQMNGDGLYLESPSAAPYNPQRLTLTSNERNLNLNGVPSSTTISDSLIRGARSIALQATNNTYAQVVNNSIDDNMGGAVVLADPSSYPTLRNNSITNNRSTDGIAHGVTAVCCATVDARFNWWGSTTGPDLMNQPGTGGGAQISGAVLYDPWLGKPWADAFKAGEHPWTVKAGVSTDVSTGNFYLAEKDISISTIGFPLEITRTYNNKVAGAKTSEFGSGWTWNYGTQLETNVDTQGVIWDRPDGVQSYFKRNPDNTFSSEEGIYEKLIWDPASITYRMRGKDQSVLVFSSDGRLAKEIDANGNATVITRDGSGRVTRVTEPSGRALTFDYQGQYISRVTDPLRRTCEYFRDSNALVTSVTKRDQFGTIFAAANYGYGIGGPWEMTQFNDGDGNHLSQTFEPVTQRVATQQYDGLATIYFSYGNPSPNSTTVQDTNGRLHVYSYYPNNKVLQHQHQQPNGSLATEDEWSYVGYIASAYTNFDGTTHSVFDWSTGNLIQLTEQGGRTTLYSYDQCNNLASRRDNLNRVTSYLYDAHQNLIRETNALNQVTSHQYYPNGQKQLDLDALSHVTSFIYDPNGYPLGVTNAAGETTHFEYDAAGRKTAETNPLGHRTIWTYNGRDQLVSVIDPLGNQTTFNYDAFGRKVATTDAEGHTSSYSYNPLNRLSQIIDAHGGTVQMFYDGTAGNLTQAIDPNGHSTTFTYDDLNRKTSETDALNRTWRFEYVGRDRIFRSVDATNASTYHYYDQFNQLAQVSYPDGRTAYFSYDGVGNRTGLTDWNGSTSWGYDPLNRSVGASRGPSSVNYGYDATGNLTALTYPNGGQVFYGYDAVNRMTTVTDFSGRLTRYSYDSTGNLASCAYPNGVVASRTFDNGDRLSYLKYAKDIAPLTALIYTYDHVGNRLTKQLNGAQESYGYDALSRLTSAIYPEGRSVSFDYDAAGNRTFQFDTRNGFGQTFSYDAANEMLNDDFGSRRYDANGAFSGGARPQTLWWNGQHLLEQMQDPFTTMYSQYDGEGRRIRHTNAGVTTNYVVDTLPTLSRVLVATSSNGVTTFYIYGLDLLYTIDGSGPHYVHPDALGSIVLGTDQNGTIEGQFQYDVFGRIRTGSGYNQSQRWFAGEETDISELIFLRARYYDPLAGRFLSRDVMPFEISTTQANNQYAYVENNPVNSVDASGACSYCGPLINGVLSLFLFPKIANAPAVGAPLVMSPSDATINRNIALNIFGGEAISVGLNALRGVYSYSGIGATGAVGQRYLERLGGESQRYFPTAFGARYVDLFVNGAANESKVGYTALTSTVRLQVAKDVQLLNAGRVDSAMWHFFTSPVTGLGGPSRPLLNLLRQSGIGVIIH